MPMKLPKGFTRRKSSANPLDEVENNSQPSQPSSFRVIERHTDGDGPFHERTLPRKWDQDQHPYSHTGDSDGYFVRGALPLPKNRYEISIFYDLPNNVLSTDQIIVTVEELTSLIPTDACMKAHHLPVSAPHLPFLP